MSGVVHPEWLAPALATLLGAGLLLAFARRRAGTRLARLLGSAARLEPPARDALLLLALAALLTALVAPRGGERERRVAASGGDLVLLFDVSRSMDAGDTPPSRLARARRAADELLVQLAPGDRVALAAFASRGALLTPLSSDHEALRELVAGLDSELIAPRGSALAHGVQAALPAFEAGSERPRTLLVLSDGEDTLRGRELPLAELARADVRVLAAAFGSEAGALLPDHGAPLVDATGRPVLTRRTLGPLERLAQATAGEVFRADAFGVLPPGVLASAVRRAAAGADTSGFVLRRERAPLVWPFAAAAFALLLLEALPAPRRPRAWRRAAFASAALGLLAAGPLSQSAALRLQRSGLARLEQGDSEGAARDLAAAALATRDPALAALAYYHLGVAQLAASQLEAARAAFFDALALAPDDARARFNAEWTLAALKRRPPPAPPDAAPPPPRPPPPRAGSVARPDPSPSEPGERPPASALDADERQRLRDRVPDDPRRALRLAARAGADAAPHAGGPQW